MIVSRLERIFQKAEIEPCHRNDEQDDLENDFYFHRG